jgi:serine/threonine protein kinase
MKYFKGYEQISKYSYDLTTDSFRTSNNSENYFLNVIEELYTYLEVLHTGGIVLGDLNPQNILISTNLKPVIVDIDSAQVGTFYSNSQRKEYRDPKVQMDGFGNNKFFVYSTDSDIFSLGIIFYELIIGSNPYFYQTDPPTESYYKKQQHISLLDYILIGTEKELTKNINIVKNEFYYSTLNRVIYLSESQPRVIEYFMNVFMNGILKYFYLNQQKTIPKISFKKYKHLEGVDHIMSYSKEDPKELIHFMNQFQINI